MTNGAGVDKKTVIKPSKRVRNWRRRLESPLSMRHFAHIESITDPVAVAWFTNKKASR